MSNSDSNTPQSTIHTHQTIALVAIGAHFPFADSFSRFTTTKIPGYETFDLCKSQEPEHQKTIGHQFKTIDKKNPSFGIPPLFRSAVSDETYLALKAAKDALDTLDLALLDKDKVDVLCGHCLGFEVAYNNAIKIEAMKSAARLYKGINTKDDEPILNDIRSRIKQQFGASSHDKVGEMASSIPARIAHFFKFRGKCQSIDAFDQTGRQLIANAMDSLQQTDSKMVVLTTAQRFSSPSINQLLLNKTRAETLTEGAVTLVVTSQAYAAEKNLPVIALINHEGILADSGMIEFDQGRPCDNSFALANQQFYQMANLLKQTTKARLLTSVNEQDPYHDAHEDIAIVGYSSMAGNCQTPDAIWQQLTSGTDNIRAFSSSVIDTSSLYYKKPGALSTYINQGAFLDALDSTLPVPMTPIKKQSMDSIQKMGLIAFADSIQSFDISSYQDHQKPTGIFFASTLAISKNRELIIQQRQQAIRAILPDYLPSETSAPNLHQFDGLLASQTAELINKHFKLAASCQTVEAACASSLAAIHNAVRALQSGRLDLAIAGGFEIPCNEKDLVLCSAQMMLSPTKISPFDQAADGFTPGDGGGLFILKRVSDARSDNDKVLGVIRGISGSCDAKSMTAPDKEGQHLAMKKALDMNHIDPNAIRYIETHGTGTILGDQTEVQSIGHAYAHRTAESPILLGSVKATFGHCFAGSGSLGLSKVLLQFEAGSIPALKVTQVSDQLPLSELNMAINQESYAMPSNYIAAVNSFGTGGLNYHLIIETPNNNTTKEA
ncbi:MAG: polyketide synthase [Cellvibrionales bacterium]|nr:polyketide synthase [Cellvibrionales bacterium]